MFKVYLAGSNILSEFPKKKNYLSHNKRLVGYTLFRHISHTVYFFLCITIKPREVAETYSYPRNYCYSIGGSRIEDYDRRAIPDCDYVSSSNRPPPNRSGPKHYFDSRSKTSSVAIPCNYIYFFIFFFKKTVKWKVLLLRNCLTTSRPLYF